VCATVVRMQMMMRKGLWSNGSVGRYPLGFKPCYCIFLFLLEKIKRIVIVKNERRQTWRERGCLAPGLTAQHGPCEFHGPCVQTCVETRDDRPPALVARGYLQGENRWGKCTYVTSLNLLQSPISLS